MKTKTIRYFDDWVKIRNNIVISYNAPWLGCKTNKKYFKIEENKLKLIKIIVYK